jgi:argininosuccinate synthase
MTRIVLAYSGGLDTSIAIPWLADTYGAEIIAVTIDLGQGRDLEEVRDRALANGALRAHVMDVRYEFARDFIVRALKAGVLCRDGAPLASALGRPLIAQTLVTIAHIEQAASVAHGDRDVHASPIELAVRALDPALTVIAPVREWGMTGEQLADYARQRSLALPIVLAADGEAPRSAGSPDEPAFVDIRFERGAPMAINGVAMHPLDLIGSLDIIAGAHGVGRVEKVEPSALLALHTAHQELSRAMVTGAAARASAALGEQYRQVVRDGSWFGPARLRLDAEVDALQTPVSGVIRLKLFKGDSTIVDCKPGASPAVIPLVKAAARPAADH